MRQKGKYSLLQKHERVTRIIAILSIWFCEGL